MKQRTLQYTGECQRRSQKGRQRAAAPHLKQNGLTGAALEHQEIGGHTQLVILCSCCCHLPFSSSFLSSVAFRNLALQIPFAAWLQKDFPYSVSARKPFWRWLPIVSSQCEHKGNSFLPCFLLKQSSLQSYHQQTLAEAAHIVIQLTVTGKIKVVWFQHSSLILVYMMPKEINL